MSAGVCLAADATSTVELTSAVGTVTDQLTSNFWTVFTPAVGVIAVVFGITWVVGIVIRMIRRHAK